MAENVAYIKCLKTSEGGSGGGSAFFVKKAPEPIFSATTEESFYCGVGDDHTKYQKIITHMYSGYSEESLVEYDTIEDNIVYELNSVDCGYVKDKYKVTLTLNDGSTEVKEFESTSIDGAFLDRTDIKSAVVGDGITSIQYAFQGCTSLTSATLPESVTSMSQAFMMSGIKSVNIPTGVTSLYATFNACYNLETFTIPSHITNIYNGFRYSTNLKSVVIENGLTGFDYDAFEGCTSLTSITLPESVKTIGFMENGFETFVVPNTVTSVTAFYNMENLRSVTLPSGLIGECPSFQWCERLESVNIPTGITSISDYTFEGCSHLSSISIPDGVTYIGTNAFYNCEGLGNVTLPNSLKTIGAHAFGGAMGTGMDSVSIPSSVESIGDGAFEYNENLMSITINGADTVLGNGVFDGINDLNIGGTLTCYESWYNTYKDKLPEIVQKDFDPEGGEEGWSKEWL